MSTIINFRQIMKITLTLISFLRPVFFTDRSTVSGMAEGSLKKSDLFSASQIPCLISPNFLQYLLRTYNISVSCKNRVSTETKLHSKVTPRFHNEDNPGDKG